MKKFTFGALVVLLIAGLVFVGCDTAMDPGAGFKSNVTPVKAGEAATAAAGNFVYLKGDGSKFDGSGWKNTFAMTEELGDYPSVWHLVYSGDFKNVTYMQITFKNGEVFEWTTDMGPSVNNGGNNPGWVIYAPYDWEIDYVNKGNNNQSNSFLKTVESKGNPNFNISGFSKGKPNDPPPLPKEGSLAVTASAIAMYEEITLQEVTQRNVWDIFERNVWDILERNIWDELRGTTQDVFAPQFKRDVSSASTNTLVTRSNKKWNNGQTWVEIDAEAAKAGLSFEIADSSPNNIGTGYFYNVKVEDGKLYITFDNIQKADIGVWAADKASKLDFGHPNGKEGNSAVKKLNDESYTFELNATADANGTIYLFVHIAGGLNWFTTGEYEFVGWKLINTLVTSPVKVGEGASPYLLAGTGASEYVKTGSGFEVIGTKLVELGRQTLPMAYEGAMQLVVKNEAGLVIYEGAFNGSQNIDNLPAGLYTVILSGEGFSETKTVTVEVDKVNALDFGEVVSSILGEVTVYAEPINDDNSIDPVYKDNKVPEVKNDIRIDAVILSPEKLPAIYRGNETDPFDPDAIRLN